METKRNSNTTTNVPLAVKSPARGHQVQTMIATFGKSPEGFLDQLQFLWQDLERHVTNFYEDARAAEFKRFTNFYEYARAAEFKRWDGPTVLLFLGHEDDFNSDSFVRLASDTYTAWEVLRNKDDGIAGFDGATLLPLIQMFRGPRPLDPRNDLAELIDFPLMFSRFRGAIDEFALLLDGRGGDEPTESEIRRVRDALTGMPDKNADVWAITKAAKMRKSTVCKALKLIRAQNE